MTTVDELFDFAITPSAILRRFAWSALGLGLLRAKGVATLPLALWILGARGYGFYTVALTTGALISSVAILNLPDGAGRVVIGASSSAAAASHVARIRRVGLVAAALVTVLGGIVAAIAASPLALLTALIAASAMLFKVATVHLEYFQQARRLTTIQIVADYGGVSAGLLVSVWLGAEGLLATYSAVFALTAAYVWRTLKAPDRKEAPDVPFWRPALRLALPLLPVSISQWALLSLDTLLIYAYRGATPTGAYSAAYSLSSLALFFPNGLNAVWYPTAQRLYARARNTLVRYSSALACVILLASVIVIAITLAASGVVRDILDGPEYRDVPSCLPWIVGGFFALAFAHLFGGIVYAAGRPVVILAAYCAGAILNLGLNLVLIPRDGILGAAYATTAGYGATALALAFAVLLLPRRAVAH